MLFYMTERNRKGHNAFNQKTPAGLQQNTNGTIMRRAQVYRWQIPMDAGVVLRERRLKPGDGFSSSPAGRRAGRVGRNRPASRALARVARRRRAGRADGPDA